MRSAIAIFLAALATSAAADWTKVAETSDVSLHVDTASIRASGEHRQAAVVHDFATAQADGVRSRRVVYEIDCAGDRLRSVSVSDYADAMGRGTSIATRERESDWMYVAPRTGSHLSTATTYRAVVRFVCAR